jgi:hypothetical protein
MRRVWAAVISVWATLAITAGIAWTRHPATPASSAPTPAAVVVNGTTLGKGAVTIPVSTASAATHTTTRTS